MYVFSQCILPFTSTFVSLLSCCLCCCWLGEAGKTIINSLLLADVLFVCVCVCMPACVDSHSLMCGLACVSLCEGVSEVGLAEMSKAGSHAVSGAADIALTVGVLQGAQLKVKEL